MKRLILTATLLFTGSITLLAQQHTTSFDVEGIKVIFKPTVKDVISVRMYFRGGVSNYTAEQAGIEQLAIGGTTECGTKKYEANQFKDYADQYGIEIGGSADYDFSDINMICVSKYFNQGWDLFTEAVMNPVFKESEIQLLKNKILAGIKQQDTDPDTRISRLVMQNVFKGTMYATDPKGTEATISALPTDAIKNFYQQIFNKNRMFIVVAGKISKDELIAKIKASFATIPSRPYQPAVYQAPEINDNKLLAEDKALATNYVNAIMNAPSMSSPDYTAFHMGISGLSGTLFSEIRTKRNLSYSPGAYAVNMQMPYAIMYVTTSFPKDAINVMIEQLNRIKSVGVTSSGLKELKSSYITSSYVKQQESNAITGNLGQAEIMGNWDLFETAADRVEDVTAEQIQKALNKYIAGVRWCYLGDIKLANEAAEAFKIPVK
ncbi:M16 family metallopeptidase [Mucilaginibacter sp. AW1-3]